MRILFIPDCKQKGTTERIPELLRVLSKKHHVVTLAETSFSPLLPQLERAYKVFERIFELWDMPRRALKYKDVDLIFATSDRYALPAYLVSKKLGKPLIIDSHGNPEFRCNSLQSGIIKRISNITPYKILRSRIYKLMTVSEFDKKAYVNMGFDENKIITIPCCINFDEVNCASQEKARSILNLPVKKTILLFFARYSYGPNLDALEYIINDLAPSLPNVELILTGSGTITEDLPPNISFRKFVANLGLYINAADICIAPLWQGVGIFQKILQMMAYGKAVVVTQLAKNGIPELVDGVNCAMATSKLDFLEKTKYLIENSRERHRIAENGRQLIQAKYNWAIYEKELFRVIDLIH